MRIRLRSLQDKAGPADVQYRSEIASRMLSANRDDMHFPGQVVVSVSCPCASRVIRPRY
jgi:hypothetical protein